MTGFALAACISALLVGTAQAAQGVDAATESPDVAAALAARERLDAAALQGDVDTLRELLSPEVVVNDPGNRVRRRDDLLTLFRERVVVYSSVEATIDFAESVGGLVVVMGTKETVLEAVPPGAPWSPGTRLSRRFTDVFTKASGSWQLLVRQSTVFKAEE